MTGHDFGHLGGLALGLALAVATSGCIAAGLAGGPLVSAVQLIGDRTVERTVSADLAETQGVTEAVLERMAFRIERRERDDSSRRLRAVTDKVTVYVRLDHVTAKLTKVGVRVETGGMLADRDTGAQVQEQIAALLTPALARTPASDPASAEALTTLHAEIQKLRSDLEARQRPEGPAAARENGTATRVEPGAVYTVPMSAALPTVGGPAPPVSVPVPAGAPAAPVVQSASSVPGAAGDAVGLATSMSLHPAGALTPIQAATGVGTGK